MNGEQSKYTLVAEDCQAFAEDFPSETYLLQSMNHLHVMLCSPLAHSYLFRTNGDKLGSSNAEARTACKIRQQNDGSALTMKKNRKATHRL